MTTFELLNISIMVYIQLSYFLNINANVSTTSTFMPNSSVPKFMYG